MKILLIRLDKIGDLICSLPVDQCEPLKGHETFWALSRGLEFVPEHSVPRRNFRSYSRRWTLKDFFSFFRFLSDQKFNMAISFQAPWWIHLGLFLARVPMRVGVLSQWHSFLFLNKALRQKRSHARQHESDYNADLVYYAFDQLQEKTSTPILKLEASKTGALARYKLSAKSYVVVHPGMAGSALNWPVKHYIELIHKIINGSSYQIILTGTTADESWLTEIKKEFSNHSRVTNMQNHLNSHELLEILDHAKAVVAPSTGVLHLAASLGTPSLGIYSPVQVQAPLRWKARGPNVQIFSPPNVQTASSKKSSDETFFCPATFKCLGEKCINFYCLEKINPQTVFQSLMEISS